MPGPPAATWCDLVVGVDLHVVMVQTPGGPVPVPMPHPYLGLVGDPVGAAVGAFTSTLISVCMGAPPSPPKGITLINGLPAATTNDTARNLWLLPHLPMPPGALFQNQPDGTASLPLGSQTVVYGGGSAVRLGEIARSCADPVPLPTSAVVTIPKDLPVLVGGPPSFNVEQAIGGFVFGKLVRTTFGAASKVFKLVARLGATRLRNFIPKARCFFTGHPVDIATGRVMTDAVDFEMPGPIPLVFERNYSSGWSRRPSPLGYGWSHSLNRAVWVERSGVVCRLADGREIVFDTSAFRHGFLPIKQSIFDPITGYTLTRLAREKWRLTDEDGMIDEFERIPGETDPPDIGQGLARIVCTRGRSEHNKIQYRYEIEDDVARLSAVVDSGGRTIRFGYDPAGRLAKVFLPHPDADDEWVLHAAYEYSEAGDLVAATDAEGATTRYAYDRRSHLMVQETDRNGLSFYWMYDSRASSARCVRTWGDGAIFNQKLLYNSAAGITLVVDSDGNKTKYTANEAGLVTEIEDALGGKRTFTFDSNLKLASETDALGNRTVHSHDHRGRRYATKLPNGARRIWKHGDEDHPELVTLFRNERGGVWQPRYSTQGQLRAVRGPFPDEDQRFEWREGLLAVEYQGTRRIDYQYDEHKNLASTVSAGAVFERSYDRQGRLIRAVSPHGARELRYDKVGRVVQVTEPDGNVRQMHRDPEGNVLEVRDGVGSRRFSYAGMGWLASVEEDGAKVAFSYEPEGELREIQNEKRHPYAFWYDPCRRVNRARGFDRRYIDYKRDKAGQVVEIQRAGAKTAITYDKVGNIAGHAYADGTSDRFVCGLDGLLDEAENATIALRFERDVLGRVTKEFQGEQWVSTGYAAGNLVRVESSLGAAMRVTRDEAGNPQSIAIGPVYSRRQIDFTHDVEGFEVERRLPGDVTAHWDYDQAGRPGALRVRRGQSAEWAQEYVWNLDDRLSALVDSHFGKSEFVHDGRRRLEGGSFNGEPQIRSLDAVGNVYKTSNQRDRSFASGGVVRNDGDTTFAFDGLGNMVGRHELGGAWAYAWDGAGMLTEVTRPDGKKVAMTYDPLGRRVSKSMDGVETRWVWSGNTVLHETKTGQSDVTWYHEPDRCAPLAKAVGDRTFFVVSDHLGTPTAMYDGAGNLAWRMQLDLFGVAKDGSSEDGEACPWRWPGQYEDREIGLYYNRFRYYDPALGQYISEDPIGIEGGLSLYAYVRDICTAFDLFGLSGCQRDKVHVFWSGANDPRVRQSAESWSRKNRATTLEMTGRGSQLEKYSQPLDWLESGPAWRKASRHFAKRAAEGGKDVHVFINRQAVSPTSVWKTVEEPILNGYPNLTIIVHPV
jgi:RHS repeat-associated protein